MWSDHNFYSSHNVVQCDDDSISYQILASKSLLPKSMSREPNTVCVVNVKLILIVGLADKEYILSNFSQIEGSSRQDTERRVHS